MIKKGLFGLIKFFLFLISLFPFWLLYLIADGFYILLYYIIQYRRDVVHTNLANAFPDKTVQERNEIEKKYFHYLSDLIVESVKMLTISQESIKKRFTVVNGEEFTKHFNNGKNILVVTGHYGNWEWGTLGIPSAVKEKVLVVFKPQSNKQFEVLINKMRSRFGSVMIPMKQTFRKLIEYKNQPHMLVLVGDQTPPWSESNYFTSFLNQQTAVFLGVEKLAKATNNPIIYFNITRKKRGYYECEIKTLVENPKETKEYEITEIHTRELEKNIRLKPEFWLWSHRRWKFDRKVSEQ